MLTSRMDKLSKRLIAALFGLAGGLAGFLMPHPITFQGIGIGDIGPPMFGLLRFLHGGSPYDVSLRAGPLASYPFTTMLVLGPFLAVPVRFVAASFCAIISGLLALAVLRTEDHWRLLVFATPSFVTALHSVQWSPLMTAALLMPSLLPLSVVKPQLGVVLAAAGQWSRKTIAAAALLVLVSLLIFPRWPVEWLSHGSLGTYAGRSPLLVFPGFLLVAAALRWRQRDSRILLSMGIILQRFFYDQLPLFLIPRSWQQMVLLLLTSWSALLISLGKHWWIPSSGDQNRHAWTAVILGFYLPALAISLWNNRRAEQSGEAEKCRRPGSDDPESEDGDSKPVGSWEEGGGS